MVRKKNMPFSPDRISNSNFMRPVLIQDIPSDNRSAGMIERVKGDAVIIRRLGRIDSVIKVDAAFMDDGFVEKGSLRVFLLPLSSLPEEVRGLLRTTK